MPVCANCNSAYPNTVKIEGIIRNLSSRKYCLECSPFGEHNTRKIQKNPKLHVFDQNVEYTKKVISESNTKTDVFKHFNINYTGGSTYYRYFNKFIKKYNVDISHFYTKPFTKKTSVSIKNLEDYFSGKYTISSHKLRLKLINQGVKKHECENCKNTVWSGQPIPLQLDHIDGDHSNNKLENLRILCPNCHALTSTYKIKNRVKNVIFYNKRNKNLCNNCGQTTYSKLGNCRKCKILLGVRQIRPYKIAWPELTVLIEKLKTFSYLQLGKELGVSDQAIRKHLKYFNIDPKKVKFL